MARKSPPKREPAPTVGGSWTLDPATGKWHKTGTALPAGDTETTAELNDGTDS